MLGVYFSGTGNTKYCVQRFLKLMDTSIESYSIEDPLAVQEIKKHHRIIFGYPTQYSNIPKILKDFIIENEDIWKDKEIYIIVTMGLFCGDGAGILARLLKSYGAKGIGGLHLKMPDSICDEKLLKKSLEENKRLIKNTNYKIDKAVRDFKKNHYSKDGLGIINHLLGLFGQRLYFYNKTRRYTHKLKIDKDICIGCQLCIKLCPMNNLELENNKAKANDRCTMCYRCVNKCPVKAMTLLGKKVIKQGNIEDYIK